MTHARRTLTVMYHVHISADLPTPTPTSPTPTTTPILNPSPTSTIGCFEGQVRLTDGTGDIDFNSNYFIQGSVEICVNGVYTPVCAEEWDTTDAIIACNDLGYHETNFCKFLAGSSIPSIPNYLFPIYLYIKRAYLKYLQLDCSILLHPPCCTSFKCATTYAPSLCRLLPTIGCSITVTAYPICSSNIRIFVATICVKYLLELWLHVQLSVVYNYVYLIINLHW